MTSLQDIARLATEPQRRGADPYRSAAVSANAGSGKTKTLVDRVARLLLTGARAETILCLTFTKAAASEMQRRLFERLGGWAVADNDALAKELADLSGAELPITDPTALSRARRLFAQALETPGGLKIQTIHAFCERLLRQFPLEAGVSPGFSVLDDVAAGELQRRARQYLSAAARDPETSLGEAYTKMSVSLDWKAFENLFDTLIQRRQQIATFLADAAAEGGLDAAIAKLLDQDALHDPSQLEQDALADGVFDEARYLWAAADLARAKEKTSVDRGADIQAVIEARRNGRFAPEALWAIFFTADGEGPEFKSLSTKSVDPAVRDWLIKEQVRLVAARNRIRAARIGQRTRDLLYLGAAYGQIYASVKQDFGALDFADLIAKASALLDDQPAAAWVLYKLDGGVDHILVDEAQDTAPDQWRILNALTSEFFAGLGARASNTLRSIFLVGDKKQSIFSFQGAAPREMALQTQRLIERAGDAGSVFDDIELTVSWRSTPEVLTFVDAVFADTDLAAHLSPGAEVQVPAHVAYRQSDHGTVDLWPLDIESPKPVLTAWDNPVDAKGETSAVQRLADRVAEECKAIVHRGDSVRERSGALRPASYGDILILVRKRGEVFDTLLRTLKRENVPVAGADQLKLSEHLVFEDLRSLARFCLYPRDDLSLAEVLRSPLCDLDETDLFDLANPRQGSLYASLSTRAAERPSWKRALDFLSEAREQASRLTPFDFFTRLMGRADPDGYSLRRRYATRLGSEAEEALDAFIQQVLSAEARSVRDLEQLCAELERLRLTLKRELDEPKGEVRIMTAHGAKGLEAPIVFLPDTVFTKTPNQNVFFPEGGGVLLLEGPKTDCPAAAKIREQRTDAEAEETTRLLYVALTRARDRLILGGRKAFTSPVKGWRTALEAAASGPLADQWREIETPTGFRFQRFGVDPMAAPQSLLSEVAKPEPPSWLRNRAPADPPSAAYASPSTYAQTKRGPTPSPLAASAGGLGRFRRGDLIHRLFQLLPDLAITERQAAAERILNKETDLTPEHRKEMAAAALSVLNDARFAEVFGEGSRAEVAVAGGSPDLPPSLVISGRVDRMVIRTDRVLVVDFKTNRPAPDRIEAADPAYLMQMALYVAVLRAIFPSRKVEAALVWTDGPKLMPIPENLIVAKLSETRRNG